MLLNTLIEGNCIDATKSLPSESVDLFYLDPPFFSNRIHESNSNRQNRIVFHDLWNNEINKYLDFMNDVFIQSHRLLKNTGLMFVHCDWHAGHYLKIELDKIFGYRNFRNEIIWKRHNSQNNVKQGAKIFGRMHDTILVYVKSSNYKWNQIYTRYSKEYLDRTYNKTDEEGRRYALGDLSGPGGSAKGNPHYEFLGFKRYWRYNKTKMNQLLKDGIIVQSKSGMPKLKRYLNEMKGVPLSDIWIDIPTDQTIAKNKVQYPTQKPIQLLERIIMCATNESDLVVDPFCGSGTTLLAASKLNRNWIGIDINSKSIKVATQRLKEHGIEEFQYTLQKNTSTQIKQPRKTLSIN